MTLLSGRDATSFALLELSVHFRTEPGFSGDR
jgi:hypothetical protein